MMFDWPVIPAYVIWPICLAVLAAGAWYRLSALLSAGSTRPGHMRLVRTAWLAGLDLATFSAAAIVLRLKPFPLLMAAILIFGLTALLLAVQWFFGGMKNTPSGPVISRESIQGLPNAAIGIGYARFESWVRSEYGKNRWRLGLVYQGALLAICVALRVLDQWQGGWLYMMFSLMWQAAVTGVLYWQVDRKLTPRRSGSDLVSGGPVSRSRSEASTSPKPRTRKFALRADVQAVVGLTAGIWCGIFDRFLGWGYGFLSVAAFGSLMRIGRPMLMTLLGKYLPGPLQSAVPPKASLFTLRYLRSQQFWYGPGMGLVGGITGAALRYLINL